MAADVKVVMVSFNVNGEQVGVMGAGQKEFSTGSRGFHTSGKLLIGEKNYQVNVQLVEIGSKPAKAAKK